MCVAENLNRRSHVFLFPPGLLFIISGVPKLFWFKTPFTFTIFHAPPPLTVLGNQVTSCNKWKSYEVEESLNIRCLRNTLSVVGSCY
jgi:hypothetical protein